MIPEVDYLRPDSLQQVLNILQQQGDQARLLAGGTDIIPGFHINSRRFKNIQLLVDISNLPELKSIYWAEDGLHIGAASTFTQIVNDVNIKKHFPLLEQASRQIGSVQIRNKATIAGNFVNNAPCADSVPPLLVYNAELIVRSQQGRRRLPLEDFLLKPYRTQLKPDELVQEIILPKISSNYKGIFYKLGRRRGVAISRITLAILLKMEQGVFQDVRLASGAVTPIGMRFHQLEQFALGQKVNENILKEIAVEFGKQILNATGLRWSTAYKLPVAQQLCYNLLKQLTS